MATVNELAYLQTFTFRDDNGDLVTTEANGDFTKTVIANGAASDVDCTVAQVGTTGRYTPSLTPDETGWWTVIVEWTEDPTFAWSYSFQVLTAAQADPAAALAATVAAVATLTERLTSARAAKLDRIGAATIPVSSPTANAERITVRRGDTYSAALDTALAWSYDGATDLTGADSVALVIRSRSVEVTQVCTVEDAGDPVQTIIAELTGAQTDTLLQREVTTYDITALFGDDSVTLVEGKVTVQPDQSP